MNIHAFKYLFYSLLFFRIWFSCAQTIPKEVKAKIEVEELENVLYITGTVENLTDVYESLYYKLAVFKKNKINGNQSNNKQDGLFTLEPNQKKSVSKIQINSIAADQVILLLLIYDQDKVLIAKDRIVLGEQESDSNNGKAVLEKPKDGLEMLGIISDETKTKIGKDYYDYFYTFYNKAKINSPKIVTIEEEMTFARTTKISVKIDNETISEFISKPEDEFLSAMAEDGVNKVFEYLKKIEKQNKLIMHY